MENPVKSSIFSLPLQSFAAALIPVFCLIPFVTKAFHIDDPLFIWAAKQIYTNPSDFYGFTANWYGWEMPMSHINQNPPLVSYYMAFAALFTGWSEPGIHLAFLIPAAVLSLGTYYLAASFCSRPLFAAMAAVFTPVFIVSGTNVMSDTLMLTFYVWAMVLWIKGTEKKSTAYLLSAALIIGLSALTKYFGITLVPLLLAYSLAAKFRPRRLLLLLVIPLIVMAGYQIMTNHMYGLSLFSEAASYAIETKSAQGANILSKTLTSLAFTGGCLAGIFFFIPLLWTKKSWIMSAILTVILSAIILNMGKIGKFDIYASDSIQWGFFIQFIFFVFAGFHILFLAVTDLWKQRDASSLLLFLWIMGTFCFTAYVNWTTNARTVFPMVPAAAILLMRCFDRKKWITDKNISKIFVLPVSSACIIALAVGYADCSLADCQRTAARIFHAKFENYPHTIWFQGHWGFQYYMEEIGAKALDFRNTVVKQGDIVIVPQNNTNIVSEAMQRKIFHPVHTEYVQPFPWVGTMQKSVGAGFYSDAWGPLPFIFGAVPPEEYQIYLVGNYEPSEIEHFRNLLR